MNQTRKIVQMKAVIVVPLIATLALHGCSQNDQDNQSTLPPPMLSGKLFANEKGEISEELRGLVKRGTDYRPIDDDPTQLFGDLEKSMSKRREVAWGIVEQMIAPQTLSIDDTEYNIPLWHTWYEGARGNPEFYSKIDIFYGKMKACKKKSDDGKCKKSYRQLAEETLKGATGKAESKNFGSSLTDANMSQILEQQKKVFEKGLKGHEGTGFTLFSPSFVQHVLEESKGVMNCETDHAPKTEPNTKPPSAEQFSPCMREFPRSAVMVKASWQPDVDKGMPFHDTTDTAMTNLFNLSGWPQSQTATYDARKMYTVETREGRLYGLRSIHFSTKDTREWIWVSLWWDPKPNSDFGQDRPDSIDGVWANYKMCVTSAFNEKDPTPWKGFEKDAPLLAKAIKANYDTLVSANSAANGSRDNLTTWCSNPNVETDQQNHKTNCIGCHQYAGSWSKSDNALTLYEQTLVPRDRNFPQLGRDRHRETFLSDFAWGVALYENVPKRIATFRKSYGIEKDE